jgi:hypothetical protein
LGGKKTCRWGLANGSVETPVKLTCLNHATSAIELAGRHALASENPLRSWHNLVINESCAFIIAF